MNSIHSNELGDIERNLYYFKESIVTDRLIKALEHYYEHRDCDDYKYYESDIRLVPSNPYFLCYESDTDWYYKIEIQITQEQVDKYLLLFDVTSISFLDYMEAILEESK